MKQKLRNLLDLCTKKHFEVEVMICSYLVVRISIVTNGILNLIALLTSHGSKKGCIVQRSDKPFPIV